MPIYKGGFLALADKLGGVDVVGYPQEDESYIASSSNDNEYGLQVTDRGLFVYSKAGNTPIFLSQSGGSGNAGGSSGPVQHNWDYPGVVSGNFGGTPAGVILHGSRSGQAGNTLGEFWGTSRYAVDEPNGLGWNATIGPGLVSIHMQPWQWGYNARSASSQFIAVEFAQGTIDDPITDSMIDAFCWFYQWCKQTYPGLSNYFPTHGELDNTPVYGGYWDGKTDIYGKGDWRADEVRKRINSKL